MQACPSDHVPSDQRAEPAPHRRRGRRDPPDVRGDAVEEDLRGRDGLTARVRNNGLDILGEDAGGLGEHRWKQVVGKSIQSGRLAIDTGYESPAVYAWARKAGHAQVAPVKGVEGFNRAAPIAGPTHIE